MSSSDEEVDGAKIAAQILNAMKPSQKDKLVQNIERQAPELAEKISDNLVRFDDIADLPAKGIQILAQSVNHHDLVLALKKAEERTKNIILDNVSQRKKELIIDEVEALSPTPVTDVDAAQKRILKTLDDLRTEGKIRTESIHDIYV